MSEKGLVFDDEFWSNVRIDNQSGVELSRDDVTRTLRNAPEVAALTDWLNDVHGSSSSTGKRKGTLWDRDKYVTPNGVFSQYSVSLRAAEHDDVVSGVVESTEGLVFSKMSMEADEDDEEDVWNQIAKQLDLDSRMREMWREMFIYSQVVVGMYWGTKTFTVRGKTKKDIKRKKKIRANVPLGMTMLDPFKIVPVGNFMFNKEKLAYIADPEEMDDIQKSLSGSDVDPMINALIKEPYTLTKRDQKMLTENGVIDRKSANRIFLLNDKNVFRHTETRPQYQPWPNLRMKSVFELLDIKNQLRQMDRAHLIGGTNFIVLIKKGSDQHPATQREVNSLQGLARSLARVPMLIGDHRLSVDIVTPDTDNTLIPEKYNAIDARITARLYQMFMTGNFAAGAKGDDSIKLARVVARGLESRRHQLKRTMERNVWQPIVDANPDEFEDIPDLRFTPKRIALDFDTNLANYMLELANRGDISRDTLLAEFDFDEDEEAKKRKRSKENGYDDVFQTAIPFSSPNAQPFGNPQNPQGNPQGQPGQPAKPAQTPRSGGRSGGTRNGGGAAPGTNQGKTKDQQADEELDES